MKLPQHLKIGLLFAGDLLALYAALLLTLFVRYGLNFNEQFTDNHLVPFSLIFPLWIIVFYSAGLYDLPKLRNNLDFLKNLSLTISINALLTVSVFYLIPAFGITPKTNLFIFILIFALLESLWRRTFNIRASFREGLSQVLLLDHGSRAHELANAIASNPQLGYTLKLWLEPQKLAAGSRELERLARENGINLVVVPAYAKNDPAIAKTLYDLLELGIETHDVSSFSEIVFRKVPLSDLRESWFLEHHLGERRFYDDLKRTLELFFAALLTIALLPLELLIALLIRLTSSGPIIYAQKRMGKNRATFTLYKFRTMKKNAEERGPQWADGTNDKRSTAVGRILRYTHLDELPQLINIIRGEMSFVGPRPERPEFVSILEREIPYYHIRHLVKPGVTGWAQVNYRYGASTGDAAEKLEYDIYYIKNRSIVLDCAIIVKTLRTLFVNHS